MTDCLPAIAALHYVTKKIKQFLLGSILLSIYFLFEGSVLILRACSRLGCYQHGRKARINENEGQDWVLGKTACLWAHFIKIPRLFGLWFRCFDRNPWVPLFPCLIFSFSPITSIFSSCGVWEPHCAEAR